MQAFRWITNNPRAVFNGALALGAMAVYASTYDPKYHTGFAASDPNALMLPRFLLLALIGLSAAAFVQDATQPHDTGQTPINRPTLTLSIVLIIATAAMPYTGFVLTVTPLIAIVTYALGERRWYGILLTSLLAGVGFWYMFHHILLIRLPSIISGGAF